MENSNIKSMWNVLLPFVLLPWTMFIGIAGQGGGIYLFAILWPVMTLKNYIRPEVLLRLFKVGFWMFMGWFVFTISNILNMYIPMRETIGDVASLDLGRKIFSSQMSSTWVISSVFIMSMGLFLKPENQKEGFSEKNAHSIFYWFSFSLLVALFVATIYFSYQFLTGADYRKGWHILSASEKYAGGYRVRGFYGHPLTMSGVMLNVSMFYGYLALFAGGGVGSFTKIKFHALSLMISLLALFVLLLAGGRTAIVTAAIFIGVALFVFFVRYFGKLKAFLVTIFLAGLAFLVVSYLGLFSRFVEVSSLESLSKVKRFVFWKVHLQMFLDNPIWGQGTGHMSVYVRDLYYNALGYADFERKFNAHNNLLEILAATGLLGLGVIFYALKTINKFFRDMTKEQSGLYWAMLVAFLANALHSVTQNVFFDSSVMSSYVALSWVVFWMRAVKA